MPHLVVGGHIYKWCINKDLIYDRKNVLSMSGAGTPMTMHGSFQMTLGKSLSCHG